MSDDDELLFDDDIDDGDAAEPAAVPWKVMIVDDDDEVHAVTRFALGDLTFLGRPLAFVSAHSAAEAMRLLPGHPDTAIILLDVVMESDDAGLRVVRHVRQALQWTEVRIILRTGQPGMAPERAVIVDYDINDYKAKTELTDTKLFTAVIAALRSYRDLVSLEASRQGLRKIIDAAASLHRSRSLHLFANGVLTQLGALIAHAGGGILCTQRAGDGEIEVLASSGRFGDVRSGPARDALDGELLHRLRHALESGESLFGEGSAMLYLRTPNQREVVVYVEVERPLTDMERSLIAVFGNNISIGFDNLEAHERLVEANETLERRVEERTRALHEREARLRTFRSAVEHSSASIVIADREGAIEYVNPAFTRITGYTADEAIGRTSGILKSGRTPDALYRDMWTTILAGGNWRGQILNRRKDGTHYWEELAISPILDAAGAVTHFVAVKDDISPRKALEEELQQLATIDPLTGLPNRRHFFERAEQELARARRSGHAMAVLMLDVDHFKRVNDTHGHHAGDRALRAVAEACAGVLREADLCGRIGGEEFAVLLPETALPDALAVAERLRREIAALRVPVDSGTGTLALTASLGAAALNAGDTALAPLFARADAALYRAKQDGRNRVEAEAGP